MKTIVYIDGYNLYYGRINKTQYKWLDLPTLFGNILHSHNPKTEIVEVKYFTAPAAAKFSRLGPESVTAQSHYHRALQSKHPMTFSIVCGLHSFSKEYAPVFIEGKNPDKNNRAWVWKIVEKKTDVNLAMAMYRDASMKKAAQLVLCSNDSDAEPALDAIKTDFPNIEIGVITPRGPNTATGRVVSTSLAEKANWTRSHITDEELENAQLPLNVVSPSGKVFKKPKHW